MSDEKIQIRSNFYDLIDIKVYCLVT